VPPHVPSPQSAFAWQATELHDPPAQLPAPHCELAVHAIGVHTAPPHVPPPQSALDEQEHEPFLQVRPPPQSRSRVHVADSQVPSAAPAQVNELFGQSPVDRHASEHCPIDPGVAPLQTAVKPQSASVRHWFVEPTSALADTWKSLYTTRPHWFAGAAPHGVLNVKRFL
jgi:hypothetical protein